MKLFRIYNFYYTSYKKIRRFRKKLITDLNSARQNLLILLHKCITVK